LTDLALFLIDAGMTGAEFQSLIAKSFVRAALSRARMKNGRENQSRVAAMTGFSRAEVRRLVAQRSLKEEHAFGARRVLEGWARDSEFLAQGGKMKKLPLRGNYGSFVRLGRKYGADIPYKAILDELQRLDMVRVSGAFVSPRIRINSVTRRRTHALAQGAIHLSEIFRSFGYPNVVSPEITLADGIVIEVADNALLTLTERRVERSAKAFLNGLISADKQLPKQNSKVGKRGTARLLVRLSVSKTFQDESRLP
jgi:hypothetical protein